ncbi:MAG: OmpA family protein [Gemmatimonadaceae bacterium]
MRRNAWVLLAVALATLVANPTTASSQSLAEFRKKAAEAKKALEAKRKAADDSASAKAAADSAKKAKSADSATAAVAPAPAVTPASGAPPAREAKVWENYDFVPGNKVIFFTDFTEDKVGNFARRLKYQSGPVEIVERDGTKLLRSTGRGVFLIPVGKKLPERFTLEIDVLAPVWNGINDLLVFEGGATMDRGPTSAEITWTPLSAYIQGSGQNQGNSPVRFPESAQAQYLGQPVHVRVLMDSGYFKMYANERRIYNNPELAFKRDSVIHVYLNGSEEKADYAVYLTSIRVAESETDVLYDALASKGRWATQGILFATGKSDLQPESRPVLKEIAETMKQHGDLKILIEGHTDNVGVAASNLTLSDSRAAAVKAALISNFGADGSRITTKGLGDTKPSVPNTTPEGRSQNRRVEIVKQ